MSKNLSLFLTILFFTGFQFFTGCSVNNDSGGDTLEGYWKSSYDGFEISGTNFSYYSDTAKTVNFTGTIVNSPDLSSTSGYVILKIASVPGAYCDFVVGKYVAIYYKEFTGTSVRESSPWKSGGSNTGMDTQAAAAAEYTVENGYFGMFSDCIRK